MAREQADAVCRGVEPHCDPLSRDAVVPVEVTVSYATGRITGGTNGCGVFLSTEVTASYATRFRMLLSYKGLRVIYCAGLKLIWPQSRDSVTAAKLGNELCLSLLVMPNVLQRLAS